MILSGVARILKSVKVEVGNFFYVYINITTVKCSTGGLAANNFTLKTHKESKDTCNLVIETYNMY